MVSAGAVVTANPADLLDVMSPAASKTKAKAAAKPSIVMLADSSGKAKPVKPAAEEKAAKAPKTRTPRTRAAALPKDTDLKAAADELLAAADGKAKPATPQLLPFRFFGVPETNFM